MESLRLLNRDMEDMDDSFGSDSSMRFVANERSARKSIRYEILNDHKLKAVASLESQDTYLYTDQLYDELQADHINSHKLVKTRGILKWVLVLVIAFVVSVVAFFAYLLSELLVEIKMSVLHTYLSKESADSPDTTGLNIFIGYLAHIGLCCLYTATSISIVQFIGPYATGSGVPEVIGYLNGIRVSGCWNVQSFFAKVLSMIFTVPSGLIASVEGPTIHYSAMIGASVSKIKLNALRGLRNDREKRDFMTTGTAVGVAAAFRSPIGGLLLALEETATYWDSSLLWRTFLGCMVASFLVIVGKLILKGDADQFNPLSNLTYQVAGAVEFQWWEIPVFLAIGAFTGALGGLFIVVNRKINEKRQEWYGQVKPGTNKFLVMVKRFPRIFRVLEGIVCVIFTVSFGFLVAIFVPCLPVPSEESVTGINERLVQFTCAPGEYNQMASLMVNAYDNSIALLYNSETQFTIPVLLPAAIIIFLCANLAAGLGLSGGMVQPMFLVGGIWGRVIGNFFHAVISSSSTPGLYALIGSAGFIGGLTRNTISFTVILLEVSGKLHFLLPVMGAMMVGKFVGDRISHMSFYHMLMHLKNYPFLERSPERITRLLVAKQVMSPNPKVLPQQIKVKELIDLLMNCCHNGFPVVDEEDCLVGIILRRHLLILLQHRLFAPLPPGFMVSKLSFSHLFIENVKRIRNTESVCKGVPVDCFDEVVDLRPFINRSPTTVVSTSRAYYIHDLIRALGLRHVIVTDNKQKVLGMITRKDMMVWSLKHIVEGARFDWTFYSGDPGKIIG